MEKEEIPYLLYLYIHSKIYDLSKGEVINLRDAAQFLFQYRVPKKLRYLVIKEMEVLGLVEKQGKTNLKINKPKYNEEKNGTYAKILGLW